MTRTPFGRITDDPRGLISMVGERRRPVATVLSSVDTDLCAVQQAAILAVWLGVPLTVVVLRPGTMWSVAAKLVVRWVCETDYRRQDVAEALCDTLDPTGVSWRAAWPDTLAHGTRLIRDLDAGIVILGRAPGWRNTIGRLRRHRRARYLARHVHVPVAVWSARASLVPPRLTRLHRAVDGTPRRGFIA